MKWTMPAAGYAQRWAGLAAPAHQAMLDALTLDPGADLLDLGCGPGDLCALAAGSGVQVSGLDRAADMIDLASARVPAADLRLADMEELPWPDATFDAVTACNALQFADDPAVPLREARRVLKPGGRVLRWRS